MKKRGSRKSTSTVNTLRIIGGQWRGRKLNFPGAEGLRPTGDRIRETLFNWLQPIVPGAHCLDLFSGSGALGFEALSRGAATATLVEKNPQVAHCIANNLKLLPDHNGELVVSDALEYLTRETPCRYDIVFIDPPFAADLWQAVATALEQGEWLNNDAAIYIETPRNYPLAIPSNWVSHRQKNSGEVTYHLFYRTPELSS